jgi:hypothetical protein
MLTAVGLNVLRLGEWWLETARRPASPCSHG